VAGGEATVAPPQEGGDVQQLPDVVDGVLPGEENGAGPVQNGGHGPGENGDGDLERHAAPEPV